MPMEIILIRHAIAFERDRARWPDDRARPLTREGRQKFSKGAAGLKRYMPKVASVLSSPLVRARETADLLAKVAGWPIAEEVAALAPDKSPQAVIALLS